MRFHPRLDCPAPGRSGCKIGQPLVFDAVPNRRDGWEEIATRAQEAVRQLGDVGPDEMGTGAARDGREMHIEGQTVTGDVCRADHGEFSERVDKWQDDNRIPLAVKLAYTLFVAVLVPNYWRAYSPWTFLYFCDVALLLTLPALWLESPLLISLPAVGLTLPQLLWVVDFLTGSRTDGDDELYVRSQVTAPRAWAVHISRLAAVSHGLGRLAFRVRSSGTGRAGR